MQRTRCISIALFTIATMSCSTDRVNPTEPVDAEGRRRASSTIDPEAIVVTSSQQLADALIPENAGRTIHIRAGLYNLSALLDVPDGVTLEGDGEMEFDDAKLPTGFATGTRTTLRMTSNIAGNILTLGNGVTVRRLAVEDLAGRTGNTIGIMSRSAGDSIYATLEENEIINPNSHAVVPAGPAGCGVAIVTQNPNMGNAPPPHDGSALNVRVTGSLIRSATTGTGCGVFAFNFSSLSGISVALTGNVVGGGMIASGAVSRPDAVHDSRTDIQSIRNLYRNESPNPCVPARLGWNMQAGAGTPAPIVTAATERNSLRVHSQDDRIEDFTTGIFAAGGRRFFASPTAGPSSSNTADLQLIGTTVSTPSSCSAGTLVADFRLAGSIVANSSLVSGNDNTLRVLVRGVTGSGIRSNLYADVLGPTGPVAAAFQGTGNRLEIIGSPRAFEQTNASIEPAPSSEFFTGGK